MAHRHHRIIAVCGTLLVAACAAAVPAFASPQAAASAPAAKPPISQEELDALVAPIALYPDSLMTQILMASTYPLEVVEASRFAMANKDLKGDKLTAELEKQDWDASVKSLVNFPTVLDMMNQKLDQTVKLGDAFIADQKRVLDSVQKLRAKAQAQGNLKSNEQQTVTVEQAPAGSSSTQVIVIEPAKPNVIYVPTYNPTVVYGTWPAPAYPPYYYTPPGYVAAGVIGFGVGFACGAAWGYAWGNCNWNNNDINIDVNQNANFNKNIDRSKYQNQINNLNNRPGAAGGGSQWRHDPAHREGVPYRDNATAQRLGGQTSNQATQARDAFRGRADEGRAQINNGSLGAGGAGAQRPGASGGAIGSGGNTQRPAAGNTGAGGAGAQRPATNNLSSGTRTSGSALSGIGGGGAGAGAAANRGAASRSPSAGGGGAARPAAGGGGGLKLGGGGGGGGGARRR
jgi:hypothetical protein